jgi:hypothetical protein
MESDTDRIASSARALGLAPEVVAGLRAKLPAVAARTIDAVIDEVPQYGDGLSDDLAADIAAAVEMALAAFLRLAAGSGAGDPTSTVRAAVDGAYHLGRGEAHNGRTVDALLAAYRVGARVAWSDLASTAVEEGVSADRIAEFAGLVFAYIDRLSAASVAGHASHIASAGREQARRFAELARALVTAAPADVLRAQAERIDWAPPTTLTAVLLPSTRIHDTVALLDRSTLLLTDDLPGDPAPEDGLAALLVPDADQTRPALLRALAGRGAVVGPPRPWVHVAASYDRAVRALTLHDRKDGRVVDTEEHLDHLVLLADREALSDLRRQALTPFADLRPGTADRLTETLRSWLLHRGRRSAVAEDLMIHPQTVRYRMTQIRERFGDQLDDPEAVLRLTVALGIADPFRSARHPG